MLDFVETPIVTPWVDWEALSRPACAKLGPNAELGLQTEA